MEQNIILPVRIQRSRQHKTISPNGLPVKNCTRPGKYGNPYSVVLKKDGTFRVEGVGLDGMAIYNSKGTAVKDALNLFEKHLYAKLSENLAFLDELKGCNLMCFCPLTEKCHVDIILKHLSK